MKKHRPKPNSIPYYIEEVFRCHAEQKSTEELKNSYAPIMAEMLLSLLISVRAIRSAICLTAGVLCFFLLKLALML